MNNLDNFAIKVAFESHTYQKLRWEVDQWTGNTVPRAVWPRKSWTVGRGALNCTESD
jgi:hypothetical protein